MTDTTFPTLRHLWETHCGEIPDARYRDSFVRNVSDSQKDEFQSALLAATSELIRCPIVDGERKSGLKLIVTFDMVFFNCTDLFVDHAKKAVAALQQKTPSARLCVSPASRPSFDDVFAAIAILRQC